MIKRDNVDLTIYAANPIGTRVSRLKEIHDEGQNVPFCVSKENRNRERGCFIYLNTKNLVSMRVSAVD